MKPAASAWVLPWKKRCSTRCITATWNYRPTNCAKLAVCWSATATAAQFMVRDEGPGFNPGDVPDPTDPENLERESGRGLLLMRSFMDDVQYNERGNEVT